MLGCCFAKINSLSEDVERLKRDYVMEDDILREQINSIYRNVEEQRKKEASILTESTFSLGELDTKTQKVPVTIQIMPKEIHEDMQMKVELDGEQAEFEKNGSFYEATIPAGYVNIIFCRMNPSSTENNWDNKWNQTSDLLVPSDSTNCYTVAEGAWDKGEGTWSTK